MTASFTAILFDLDGTIVDSAPGITAALSKTFITLGLPVPSPTELVAFVGPPILDGFRDLFGFDSQQSQEALKIYRGHYLADGVFDAKVYPGIEQILATIHASAVPLSLATSKPEHLAKMVLEHYGLLKYFDVMAGASEDESRSAKADVVAEALKRLDAFGADLSNPVMVGDRHHDVIGAAAHDVPTVFVRWGYGSPVEEVGSIASVDAPAELQSLLLP